MTEASVENPEDPRIAKTPEITEFNRKIWVQMGEDVEEKRRAEKERILAIGFPVLGRDLPIGRDSAMAYSIQDLEGEEPPETDLRARDGLLRVDELRGVLFRLKEGAGKFSEALVASQVEPDSDKLSTLQELFDKTKDCLERLTDFGDSFSADKPAMATFRGISHAVRSLIAVVSYLKMLGPKSKIGTFRAIRGWKEFFPAKTELIMPWLKAVEDRILAVESARLYDLSLTAKSLDELFFRVEGAEYDCPKKRGLLPEIIGDPDLLMIAANELFANFQKASSGQAGAEARMRLEFDPEAEEIVFTFRDNAGGIQGDHLLALDRNLASIFEKGVSGFRATGAGESTGFGLADLKERVEAEGGTITVANIKDEGGEITGLGFEIRLPARYRQN